MAIAITPTPTDRFREVAAMLSASYLHNPPDDARWERSLPSWNDMRSFSAWDGDRCVGHAGYWEVETTVPGGRRVSTAAVTRVGVLPTHSRLGAGTGLMDALTADALERGHVLASLRASEAVIYRRYGYGVAGEFAEAAIERARARPVVGAADGPITLIDADRIEAVTEAVDELAMARRVGLITRTGPWRRFHFDAAIRQPSGDPDGAFVAAHLGPDGEPDGYVHYRTTWKDLFGRGGTGEVRDVVAVDAAVELALWRYLLDIDLVNRWTARERPVDDLIRVAVADRRAYAVTAVNDEQWVRLLDVEACLSARTYAPVDGAVVIEVTDPSIKASNGRWRISGGGATRLSVDDPVSADLTASIDAVSALYLGANSWHTEAAVGRVSVAPGVEAGGVLRLADQLFAVKPQPFCGTFF